MVPVDIKNLIKSALERVKETARLQDDDPTITHLEGTVIRNIAELEVARLQRTSAPHAEPALQSSEEDEGRPHLSDVA